MGAPVHAPTDREALPDQGAPSVGTAVPSSPALVGTAPPTSAPPADQVPEVGPVGWPERLADHPFDWNAAEPGRDRRRDSPTEPTRVVDEREDHTPTEVEQAEEEHLDWLRHLPERRDDTTAGHPPTHGRADPPSQRETPRREWAERLVVGLIAGLVTFAATRWAGAGWSTAGLIGATVLVVVPAAAWVATLGDRSSAPHQPDGQPEQH